MITLSFVSLFYLSLPALIASQCYSDWQTNVGSDGFTYGYKAVVSDMVNFFEAHDVCAALGAQVASIHSAQENAFVISIASSLLDQCENNNAVCKQRVDRSTTSSLRLDRLLRSFWIGMHRVQYAPFYNTSVDCCWSDGTQCDYGRFDGVADPNQSIPPWSTGNPSGSSSSITSAGWNVEDCVEITNDNGVLWNDIGCYHKLGGVVCKKNCTNTCPPVTTQAPAVTSKPITITPVVTTTTDDDTGGYICGSDDWQWKNNGNGKAYAYKWFNQSGSFWQLHDLCYDSCATPCSIESEEENQHIVNNICAGAFSSSSSGRKKRATDSECIYTGFHRYQESPPTGPIGCSCDDGKSCDYGNDDTTTTTSTTSTTKAATTTTKAITTPRPSTSTIRATTKATTIITSTTKPNNPWAPGCPANSTTGLGDSDGYGTKNCVGFDSNGKWRDQACERPGKGIVCKKPCIPLLKG
uniref:C-type lectin domain-containing protein n=1 Tax=Meloidogyne floridensis TaxID=298350 RepID=A0A915P1L4_9BILA